VIQARLPSALPITGAGTFVAQRTSDEVRGVCRTASTTGTFNGTFRTRFMGWGPRTLRLRPADSAAHVEDRAH
jgi:hypothetical protein